MRVAGSGKVIIRSIWFWRGCRGCGGGGVASVFPVERFFFFCKGDGDGVHTCLVLQKRKICTGGGGGGGKGEFVSPGYARKIDINIQHRMYNLTLPFFPYIYKPSPAIHIHIHEPYAPFPTTHVRYNPFAFQQYIPLHMTF